MTVRQYIISSSSCLDTQLSVILGGESVYPLSPLAVLWLNMITGGPPAFGLGVEEASEDVMTRPPQNAKTGVFSWYVIIDTFAVRLLLFSRDFLR